MPGKSKEGGGLEAAPIYKKSAFTMRSGNSPLFKMMGSSPMRDENKPIEGGTLPEVKVVPKETRRDKIARQAFKGFSGTAPTFDQASQVVRSRAYAAADEYIKKNPIMKKGTTRGSVEEKITKKEVEEGRTYVEKSGEEAHVVKSASMVNLEKNKPPTDSPNYASWKEAYDKAKAKHIARHKNL